MLLDFINPLVRDVDGIDEDPADEVRHGWCPLQKSQAHHQHLWTAVPRRPRCQCEHDMRHLR